MRSTNIHIYSRNCRNWLLTVVVNYGNIYVNGIVVLISNSTKANTLRSGWSINVNIAEPQGVEEEEEEEEEEY